MPLRLSKLLLFILGLSLLWAIVFGFNLLPVLRGGWGWQWRYELPASVWRALPLGLGLLLYIFLALRLLQRPKATALQWWAWAGAIGLPFAAMYVHSDPILQLYTNTLSGVNGGWHYAATRISDLPATLRTWPTFMHDSIVFSSHMGIAPPGWVVLYYGFINLFAQWPALASVVAAPLRAALCQDYYVLTYSDAQLAAVLPGMLMPVWGAFTVFPLYTLAQEVFEEPVARWSVLWWPLIPSAMMFTPAINVLYPLLTTYAMLWLIQGLRRGQAWRVFLAGVWMSVLTFMAFAFLPVVLFCGLFTLGFWLARAPLYTEAPNAHLGWRWPWVMGLLYGLGLLTVWVVAALGGVSFWDIWYQATHAHLALDRPYLPWLFLHLVDYFTFVGWPLALAAACMVGLAVQRVRTRAALTTGDVWAIALGLTLLITSVSGTLRGETGRILSFFSPFLLMIAASLGTRLAAPFALAGLTGVQALCAFVVAFCLALGESEFNQFPPAAPPALAAPAPVATTNLSATFGEVLHLQAFAGHITPTATGEPALQLWLTWRSTGQVSRPYYLSVLPVASDGQVGQPAMLQPFNYLYPTTCWLPSSGPLQDQVTVTLPTSASAEWWVSLALVDGDTGERLPVTTLDGAQDEQVGLGPFRTTP